MSPSLSVRACVALLLTTALTVADEPRKSNGEIPAIFKQLDANIDGVLERQEIVADKLGLFERILRTSDANGDGKLSQAEFAAGLENASAGEKPVAADAPPARPQPPTRRPQQRRPGERLVFSRLDANGDGRITMDEIPDERRAFMERFFGRADKNSDKAITRDEFDAATADAPPMNPRNRNSKRPGGPRPGQVLMRLFDTNRDGQLSSEEITAAASILRKLDANSDGNVTADELMQFFAPQTPAK